MNVWENYYDKAENCRHWPDEDVARFLGSVQKGILEEIGVMDIGCGDGRNCQAVRRRFRNAMVHGIDPFLVRPASFLDDHYLNDYEELTPEPIISFLKRHHCLYDVVIDCMTSQHFHWHEHEEYFQLVHKALSPGGWFFLKHLNSNCSDCGLTEPIDSYKATFRNIPNVPDACFPDNGLVCMPGHWDLKDELSKAGFIISKDYELARDEPVSGKLFAHSIFFCQKESK